MTDAERQAINRVLAWALARVVEIVTILLCFQIWKAIYPDDEIARSLFSDIGVSIFAAVFFQVFSGYFISTFLFCTRSNRFSFIQSIVIGLAIYLAHFGLFYLMIARSFIWEVTEFSFFSGIAASLIGAVVTYGIKARFRPTPAAG